MQTETNTETTCRSICCQRCWHSPAKPCPDYIACFLEGPLCHQDSACQQRVQQHISQLKRTENNQTVIYVGLGTCGLGAGAGRTYQAIENYIRQRNLDVDLVPVGCVGLCSAEPIVDIQLPGKARLSFNNVTEDRAVRLVACLLEGGLPIKAVIGQYQADKLEKWEGISCITNHPFFKNQTRRVLKHCGIINPSSLEEYVAAGGYQGLARALKEMTPEEVCHSIESSGLRGRGGGGFPTGKKWKFALEAAGDDKYLVCNADEGDPGAFMDRAVIEGCPHQLLEGMVIASYAIGARRAYIYIRAEYPLAIKRLQEAIQQAEESGLLGDNILASGMSLRIRLKKGAGAFVCGEETALLHSIEGKRGMPRPRPPFPAVKGLFDKPTVINNVETLANVPAILEHGCENFSALGTESSKGTKVFALSGNVQRTGLVEVEMGTRLREIVFDIGGGIPNNKDFKAVQIGGPSGGCIPEQHLDTIIDYESLKQVGAMMGSGGLVVMDQDTCMVDVAKFFMDFIQRESCGKCIPCREGTRRLLETLRSISGETTGNGSKGHPTLARFRSIVYMERLADVIRDTSLCGLGQTAPNPVKSTLRFFKEEYEAHVFERRCPAGRCGGLMQYSIDPQICVGCTLCARRCPVNAIMGEAMAPHYIIPDKCIKCGTCLELCRHKAISVH